ncbi:MAG: bifunctional riboflavin kinase/FAD synthetase [Gammaproteobacteria bacterium]
MELIRGLHNLHPRHRGCAATIGNLDGVHMGHQAVLGQLSERAVELHLPAVVITFEPQPEEYFAPQSAPPRLTRFREKIQALRRFSVDRVVCLRFDRRLAERTPDQFVEEVLVQGLGVHYLVVGDDFRFGKERAGDFSYLQRAGSAKGFQVVNMHTVAIDGERVSSTRIRRALADGDMAAAEKLLGRPYRMCGRVARGDCRGRTIGFPTANIYLHRHATPVKGVFAVEMFGLDQEPVAGVANVGIRPTVDGTRSLLEVYLFDFDRDIYGQYVHVNFLHKLRDEERYDSLAALQAQIARDVDNAQAYFSKT